MKPLRVLFTDKDNCSSALAAAYFTRFSSEGHAAFCTADASAHAETFGPLFVELGLAQPEAAAWPPDNFANGHFDLYITVGPRSSTPLSSFPGSAVHLHWKLETPDLRDMESLRRHATTIEGMIRHFFDGGYYSVLSGKAAAFENIIDSLSEGILVHDLSRKVVFFSRGAEKITGAARESVIGRDCHDLFVPRICGDRCAFQDDCAGCGAESSAYRAVFTALGSLRKELDIARFPLKSDTGEVIGAIVTMSDQTRLRSLEERLGESFSFAGIIGRDHRMLQVFELIRDIARSDFPVVISGDSGTGKELVAMAIHAESDRRDGPFVPVNCGALPEGILESELFGHVRGAFTGAIRDKKGRFELADHGTLFLDEIAELTQGMQVKLLRVLQEGVFEPVGGETHKKVDVRIICASNRNLKELVQNGKFRSDLYYRLAVMPIDLPRLRDRRNDIALLARHFLEQTAVKLGRSPLQFSDEAMAYLLNYGWPGNVRQLQNAIQFALIKCRGSMVKPEHLPPEIIEASVVSSARPRVPGKAGRRPKLSDEAVRTALEKAGGNKAKAARLLGVGRATLYNFLNDHGGDGEDLPD